MLCGDINPFRDLRYGFATRDMGKSTRFVCCRKREKRHFHFESVFFNISHSINLHNINANAAPNSTPDQSTKISLI